MLSQPAVLNELEPLCRPSGAVQHGHFYLAGFNQRVEHPIALAMIHELGATGEIAPSHAFRTSLAQDRQGALALPVAESEGQGRNA